MKKFTSLQLLGIAGLGAALSVPAWAQDAGYWYGGISAGQSNAQINEQLTSNAVRGIVQVPQSMSTKRDDTAYKLFGGYQLTPTWGLEAGYFNLGKFNYTANFPGAFNGRYEIEGANLDLVATMPLSQRWSASARLGAQYAETRGAFSGAGLASPRSPSQQETNAKVGLGLQYKLGESVYLRGEAERYRVRDSVNNLGDVNVFSLGLVFPFGGRAPKPAPVVYTPPPVMEPAPMPPPPPPPPVAIVPTPAPVAPPPPPVMQPRRVKFSADSLFDFDKSNIKAEGRAALDNFVRDLSGTRYRTITVEGHTDRLGSEKYNQKLSEERANAVRSYLAGSGVDAGRISASGKGESEPVTKPGECKGSKPTKALIACLQPDRRVDVEVTGER